MKLEFLKLKRLEDMTKSAAKTLRYSGFKAIAKSDWSNGLFRVVVKCSCDEIIQIKNMNLFSDEIIITNE